MTNAVPALLVESLLARHHPLLQDGQDIVHQPVNDEAGGESQEKKGEEAEEKAEEPVA